jgi:hypothetical protein
MKKMLGKKAYNAARMQTVKKLAPMKKAFIELYKEKQKHMKKLYWRMFQDKDNMEGLSVVITQEDMINEVNYWNNEGNEEENPPVFEPVFMEEEEFKNLPEFEGF